MTVVAFTLTDPTPYGIKSLRLFVVLTAGTKVKISIESEAMPGASAQIRQLNNRIAQALIKGICNLKHHALTFAHENFLDDSALQPTKHTNFEESSFLEDDC
jgi:hypothetical protein